MLDENKFAPFVIKTFRDLFSRLLPRSLAQRPTMLKIIHNLKWNFFEKAIRIGATFFITSLMIRHLGPKAYGEWSYALALAALLTPLTLMGSDNLFIRDLVRKPEQTTTLMSASLTLRGFGGVMAALILSLYAILTWGKSEVSGVVVLISAWSLPFLIFVIVDEMFLAKLEAKKILLPRLYVFILLSTIRIVAVFLKCPLIDFVILGFLEIALSAGVAVQAYWKEYGRAIFCRPDFFLLRRMLSEGWPNLIGSFAAIAMARVDQVMLGNMIGVSQLGQYSAANRMVEVFAVLGAMIYQSLAPPLIKEHQLNREIFLGKLCNVYRLMSVSAFAIIIPFICFGKQIVTFLFGSKYQEAGVLFVIMSIRIGLSNIGMVRSVYISTEGLFTYSLITLVCGALINIVLNWILIPYYSYYGAISASIIGYLFSLFICDFFNPKTWDNTKSMIEGVLTPWKLKY